MKRLTFIIVIALGLLAITSFKLTKDQTKQATEKTLSTAPSEPTIKEVKALFEKTLQTVKHADTTGFFNLWEEEKLGYLQEVKTVTLQGDTVYSMSGLGNNLKWDFKILCEKWGKQIGDIKVNDITSVKYICQDKKNKDSCEAERKGWIKDFGYEFQIHFSNKKFGYESSYGVSVRKINGKVYYATGCVIDPQKGTY